MSRPEAIAARPTIDPTERSIPPVKMTNVIPIAISALMAVYPTRMIRLSRVKKEGVRREKMPIKTSKAINARKRNSTSPMESLPGFFVWVIEVTAEDITNKSGILCDLQHF